MGTSVPFSPWGRSVQLNSMGNPMKKLLIATALAATLTAPALAQTTSTAPGVQTTPTTPSAQLRAADMTLDNLAKVTTYLADRRYGLENRAVRQEILGERRPASTVVITGIFNEACLLEIEAIAVA